MSRTIKDVIEEVERYMDGFVQDRVDRHRLARDLVYNAQPRGGIINIEIRGHYTKSGNPLPASFYSYDVEE